MRLNQDEREEFLRALRSAGGRRTECPRCVRERGKADRKRSLAGFPDGGFHCFRCGAHGRIDGESFAPEVQPITSMPPPEGFTLLYGDDSITFKPAREYLARRVHPDVWRAMGIGAVADGYFGGRVIVPVIGDAGEWVGFVARDWTGRAERPYLYPKGMNRAAILYGFSNALDYTTPTSPVILVEGVFDALHLWPFGVACLGKPLASHREMLVAAGCAVCVMLDGDAHDEGWAWAARLRFEGVRAGAVKLPPGTDPDEFKAEDLFAFASRSLDLGM